MYNKFFEKRIIKGIIPFVFVIVLIFFSFPACQEDEILQKVNSETETNHPFQLKSATFSAGDIDALILKIESFLSKGDLESGLANSFIVKVQNAKKSLEKENEKASANQLHALLNHVQDFL